MKILIAIQSINNAKKLGNSTLKWASRTGFDLRIFVPDESQIEEYIEAVEEANHNWYLNVPATSVIDTADAKKWAKRNGYDLIVYLPDDMNKWNPKVNHDLNPLHFARDIGIARKHFSDNPDANNFIWLNSASIERVK